MLCNVFLIVLSTSQARLARFFIQFCIRAVTLRVFHLVETKNKPQKPFSRRLCTASTL